MANNGSNQSVDIPKMIDLLWKEARLDSSQTDFDDRLKQKRNKLEKNGQPTYDSVDLERRSQKDKNSDDDFIELGILKLCLYSIPFGMPRGLLRCMPCGSTSKASESAMKEDRMKIRRSGGELISHDVSMCSICRNSVGCPACSMAEMEGYDDDLLLVEEYKKSAEIKSSPSPISSPRVDDVGEIVEVVINRRQSKK